MISYIAPNDRTTFLTAIEMLKSEFKQHLSINIIKQYLNGNPNDLGGRCAGPAGTVASNQGGERRGGWMKKILASILKMYGMTTTVNPVYFLIAAALDAEQYFPLGAQEIVTEPNRRKIEESAFKSLMQLANHNASKGNFSSDILYSICTTLDADGGTGTEVLLHAVLGKKNQHFTIFIPSIAMQCNTLRQMLLEDADIRTSGPIALMQQSLSTVDVEDITSTPVKLFTHLATIDAFTQNRFKHMIREIIQENTVTPKEGEKLIQYLRRHCHRDASRNASDRFASEADCTIGRKKTKRKGKKVDAVRQAQLEALKWNPVEESASVAITTTNTVSSTVSNLSNDADSLIGVDVDLDFLDGYKLLDDDAEPEEIEGVALLASVNNTVEEEVEVAYNKSVGEMAAGDSSVKDAIRVPRELGTGTTITVRDSTVTCNCEAFNRWKICWHCVYFEFLHCNRLPHGSRTDGNVSYSHAREKILGHIKKIKF